MQIFGCIISGLYAAMMLLGGLSLPGIKKISRIISIIGFAFIFSFVILFALKYNFWFILIFGLALFQLNAIINGFTFYKKFNVLQQLIRLVFHIALVVLFIL